MTDSDRWEQLLKNAEKATRDLEEVFEAWGNTAGVEAMRSHRAEWERLVREHRERRDG